MRLLRRRNSVRSQMTCADSRRKSRLKSLMMSARHTKIAVKKRKKSTDSRMNSRRRSLMPRTKHKLQLGNRLKKPESKLVKRSAERRIEDASEEKNR